MLALKDRKSFIKAIRTAKRVASGKRAAAACAGCKKSRAKCDDTRPCKRCRALKLCSDCKFDSQITDFTPGESSPSVCIRNVASYSKLEMTTSSFEKEHENPHYSTQKSMETAHKKSMDSVVCGTLDDCVLPVSHFGRFNGSTKQDQPFVLPPFLSSFQGSNNMSMVAPMSYLSNPWRNISVSHGAPLLMPQRHECAAFSAFDVHHHQSQAIAALFLKRLLG